MGQALCVCSRGTVTLGGARYLLLHRLAEGSAGVRGPGGAGKRAGRRRDGGDGGGLGHGGAAWGWRVLGREEMLECGRCAGIEGARV